MLWLGAGGPAWCSRPGLPRRPLDAAAARAMAGRQGSIVALDVDSGRILGSHRLEAAARRLVGPGSAVKPFTLVALASVRGFDPRAGVLCERAVGIGNRRLDCSHPGAPLPLDAVAALAYSCNHYFAQAAAGLDGGGILARTFARAGLDSPSGLVPGEATGAVHPARETGERQLQALGEWGVEVTQLGMLAAYRRLALGRKRPVYGFRVHPAVYEGLDACVAYGTGRLAQTPGLDVAGKTGTALAPGGYTHAWFLGYAPARSPEIVLVVFLERGRGGADAAPVARAMFAAWRARDFR